MLTNLGNRTQKSKSGPKKKFLGCRIKITIGVCSRHAYAMLIGNEESEKIPVAGTLEVPYSYCVGFEQDCGS